MRVKFMFFLVLKKIAAACQLLPFWIKQSTQLFILPPSLKQSETQN